MEGSVQGSTSHETHRRLLKIAEGLERDRREPDKVLTYTLQLKRLAFEMAEASDV